MLPRCMGGGDEHSNIVRLTPEEHFLAHQLLVKIHPENDSLVFALTCMVRSVRGQRANNKLFGWMRRRVSRAMRDMKKGKPRSAEVRAKLSAANKGRPLSAATRAKMSAVRKGRKLAPAHSAAISASLMGNKKSAKSIEMFKTMLANRTPEEISSAARKAWETRKASGRTHPLVGRKLSESHKRKISQGLRNRAILMETEERLRTKSREQKDLSEQAGNLEHGTHSTAIG